MSEELTCNSCDQPKNKLSLYNSKLLPGMKLYMCQTCLDAHYEPRWIIILAGRRYGANKVKEIILKEQYIGDHIKFAEIIK